MSQWRASSQVHSSIASCELDLPRILPVFERTEPRTTHHWKDAIHQRRLMRKSRRTRLNRTMAASAMLLAEVMSDHRNKRPEQ